LPARAGRVLSDFTCWVVFREKWEELKEEYSELPKEYRLPEETESSGAGIGESVESGWAVHDTALEDRRRRREARKGKNIPERS